MKEKLKIIINKLGMLLLITTIVTFNLIIGNNEEPLLILPVGILTGLLLAFLLIKKLVYKEKIIKNKIDIAVSIFMFILFLPLIFRTYCSLQGTIDFILKYFFIYSIYLLTRNVVNTKKRANIIIIATLISSLINIGLGLDMMHGNYLKPIREMLGIKYEFNYRFSSTFGYANTASIYTAFCVFLALNRCENTKLIIGKILYVLYIILGSYIIYISYSRFILLLYVIIMLIYFSVKIYNRIKNNKNLIRYTILVVTLIFVIFVTYIIIALNYSCPVDIYNNFKFRYNFEKNKNYQILFDVEVIEEEENYLNPRIQIIEVNKYFSEKELATKKVNKEKREMLEFNITPTEDVYYLKLNVEDKGKNKVIINKCYIDGKEYIFSYKFLPKVISRFITSFSLNDDSIVLRREYYENCLRIAKDSPIIGHGGNTWKRISRAYENYAYYAKEAHSYFFELLISYGIVGVIAFSIVIVFLCKKIVKELILDSKKRKQKLSIFIGLMFLILYCYTFDFCMSFILILLMVFIYIAILQFDDDTQTKIKGIDWTVLILLMIVSIFSVINIVAKYFVQDPSVKANLVGYNFEYNLNSLDENNVEQIKNIMINEPYIYQNYMYDKYWKALYNNIQTYDKEKLLEYINFGIERFKNIKMGTPMFVNTIIQRTEVIAYIINNFTDIQDDKIKESINDLRKIAYNEYEIYSENIKDLKRNGKDKYQSQIILDRYKSILESAGIKID